MRIIWAVSYTHLDVYKRQGKLSEKYKYLLAYFLRRRLVACLVSVAMVVLFLVSCLSTNMVLIPEMDQGMVSVTVEMPTGTELEDTMAYGDRVMGIIQENCPELDNMYMTIGSSMSTGGSSAESVSYTHLDVYKRQILP